MKKTCCRLILGSCILALATFHVNAQKIWGTLPNAFYNVSPDGTSYEEIFNNFNFGSQPEKGIFIGPDGSVYASTANYGDNSIFRYRTGDFLPTVLYPSDSSTFVLQIADFDAGYFYGKTANSLFRARIDGTELTILKQSLAGESFDVHFVHENYLYGINKSPTPNLSYLFRMGIDGSDYEVLREFSSSQEQISSFILVEDYDPAIELWAIAPDGGIYGMGAVFSVNLDGTDLKKLIDFKGTSPEHGPELEYGDIELNGRMPIAIVKDIDSDVYIITKWGGTEDTGGIYMIGQDGLHTLHNFPYWERNPAASHVIDEEGTLFGYTGLFNEDSGFLYSYNPREGFGYNIVENFTASNKVGWPHSIARADNGVFFGLSEMSTLSLTNGTLFSINQDGTNLQRIFYFKGEAFNPRWVVNVGDTVFGVFTNTFEELEHPRVGSLFTYTETEGLSHIHKLPEETADSIKLTAGNDGYIYGVTSQYDYIFKADINGPSFERTNVPGLDTHTALSQTTQGLFGTSFSGGANNKGYIFKVKSDFSGITILHSFSQATGDNPHGKLIDADRRGTSSAGYLFGTTKSGGSAGYGVIYKFDPMAQTYENVYSFSGGNAGAYPLGGLVRDVNGKLYGTTSSGGRHNAGILFRVNTDGTGFTKLFDFRANYGKVPFGELLIDNNGVLFGLTSSGGAHNSGVLYRFTPGGQGYLKLKDFSSVPLPNLAFADSIGLITQVIEPMDGMTDVSINPLLRFMPVPGAIAYIADISKTPDFTDDFITETRAFPWAQPAVMLDYNTKYYTRVRTNVNPHYGKITSFTTHSPEKNSFISIPANGATNVAINNLAVTASPVQGATLYTIELNTAPDFTGTSFVKSSAIPNQRTLIFNGLSPGTLYYGRTMTNLPSDWGPVRSFTTRYESALLAYPNPFSEQLTVEIDNKEDGHGRFVMYDLAGRELENIPVTGNVSITLGNHLQPGVYILRYTGKTTVVTHKVIKK